jgi:hypothetical protein
MATDQEIREAGYYYIPPQEYLANPFKIPTTDDGGGGGGGGGGIPYTNAADGFNPYNTDMSKIRQDYNAFPSRQAGEIYSKTFNPQSTFDPNLVRAQSTANLIRNYESGTGPGVMRLGNTVFDVSKFSPDQRASMLKSADNFIDDARMQYATEGQFVDPYDPNYSSMTEAQKFMDNYPDYYGVPSGVPEPGIPGAIKSYMQNSLLGKGLGIAKNFIDGLMPINERAIMENEARGAGIFTDDIGRIVTDDYNTAGGIMAGYNLNKIDSGTFDKRRGTIEKTLGSKYNLSASQIEAAKNDPNYTGPGSDLINRLGLLDEAEEDILGARKKTKLVYKMKKDKKDADKKIDDTTGTDTTGTDTTGTDTTSPPNNNPNQDHDNDGIPNNVEAAGGSYDGGYHGAEGGFENTDSSGWSGGSGNQGTTPGAGLHADYSQGGRVYLNLGGLISLL